MCRISHVAEIVDFGPKRPVYGRNTRLIYGLPDKMRLPQSMTEDFP
jgi:hypothetical protein